MKNLIAYFKDTLGKMLWVFFGIVGIITYGAINDMVDDNGNLPIIIVSLFIVIYIILFIKDYNNWKSNQ